MTAKSTRHRTRGPLARLARACVRSRVMVVLTWASIVVVVLVVALESGGAFVRGSMEPGTGDLTLGLWSIVPVALLCLLILATASTSGAVIATAIAAAVVSACTTIVLSNLVDMGPYALVLSVTIGGPLTAAWGASISMRYLASRSLGHDVERGSREALASAGRAVVAAALTAIGAAGLMWLVGQDAFRGDLAVIASNSLIACVALATLLPALYGLAGDRVTTYATGRAASTEGGLHRWSRIASSAQQPLLASGLVVGLGVAGLLLGSDLHTLSTNRTLGSIPRLLGLLIAIGIAGTAGLTLAFRSLSLALRSLGTTTISLVAAAGLGAAIYSRSGLRAVDAAGLAVVLLVVLLAGLANDSLLAGRMRRGLLEGEDLAVNLERSIASACLDALTSGMAIALAGLALMRSSHEGIATLGLALAAAALFDALLVRCVIVPAATHMLGSANFRLPSWADVVMPVAADTPVPQRTHISKDEVTTVKSGSVVSAPNVWADEPRVPVSAAASRPQPGMISDGLRQDHVANSELAEPSNTMGSDTSIGSDITKKVVDPAFVDPAFIAEEAKRITSPRLSRPAELAPGRVKPKRRLRHSQPANPSVAARQDPDVRAGGNENGVSEPLPPVSRDLAAQAKGVAPDRVSRRSKRPSKRRNDAATSPLADPYLAALSHGKGLGVDEPDATRETSTEVPGGAITEIVAEAGAETPVEPLGKESDPPPQTNEFDQSNGLAVLDNARPAITDSNLDRARLNGLPELFQR
ncbi:MAG: MMPL family transporter, partial [Acidimicrobiales bacterium]